LRFDVDAQRIPAGISSPFIAAHAEQPDARHSRPASTKMRSRPSASACRFTCDDPGDTQPGTTDLRPLSTAAAARRSSMRALVHVPMNARSIGMSVTGIPGFKSM
jgi:hypothetical protein